MPGSYIHKSGRVYICTQWKVKKFSVHNVSWRQFFTQKLIKYKLKYTGCRPPIERTCTRSWPATKLIGNQIQRESNNMINSGNENYQSPYIYMKAVHNSVLLCLRSFSTIKVSSFLWKAWVKYFSHHVATVKTVTCYVHESAFLIINLYQQLKRAHLSTICICVHN